MTVSKGIDTNGKLVSMPDDAMNNLTTMLFQANADACSHGTNTVKSSGL